MVNYQNGKIYAIKTFPEGLTYIGSTTKSIDSRLRKHIREYKRYKKGKSCYVTSYEIFESKRLYYIELLENVNANNKLDLLLRERHHIKNNRCVNKNKNVGIVLENNGYLYYDRYRNRQKINCCCGIDYIKRNRLQHKRSKTHTDYRDLILNAHNIFNHL